METENYYKRFSELNRKFWIKKTLIAEKRIFVYVGTDAPVAIIECMLLAKKISEKNNQEIDVLFWNGEDSKKDIYKSFNIGRIYREKTKSIGQKLWYALKAVKIWAGIKSAKDILNIEYCGIPIGEELYDAIIRFEKGTYTIDNIKFCYIKEIAIFLRFIDCAYKFLGTGEYDTYIYCDGDYYNSVFGKIAKKRGIKVYQAHHGKTIIHNECNELYKIYNNGYITWNQYNNNVRTVPFNKIADYLRIHFSGNDEKNFDNTAYKGKRLYSKNELLYMAKSDSSKKCVLVAAHAFSDLPHFGRNMVFLDYYDWLVKTLQILNDINYICVFVKEHPSAYWYGEEASVNYIIEKYGLGNVTLLPQDCSTMSVFDTMDYIVTCQGTIALEAALYGIPTFTASQGYYHHFGIGINSVSKEEYEYKLRHILDYGMLTDDIYEKAARLIYLCYKNNQYDTPSIIPPNRFRVNKDSAVSFEDHYKYMIEKMQDGANIKDAYYESLLDERTFVFDEKELGI